MEKARENKSDEKPLILIVDDTIRNLQVVASTLYDEGYNIAMAESGAKALEFLENEKPDLILLDIMMPEMDGYEVCKHIKDNPSLDNIPVIFLTSKTDTEDVLKGFKIGGVDYVTKPFEKEILLVRIKTHIDLKLSREELSNKTKQLSSVNKSLTQLNKEKDKYLDIINHELEIAAEYVTKLLPEQLKRGKIRTDWKFVPSQQLGGDSFGYHWLDDENMAIYLLDVCYHGVGPALLSTSVLNLLRFQNLRKTDFHKPNEVLRGLNRIFQMTEHNDMYFSIWYGVYNIKTRKLDVASAGHPPALLVNDDNSTELISTKNIYVGVEKKYRFKSENFEIPENSTLYIFSDGVFEIEKEDGSRWDLNGYYEFLSDTIKKHNLNGEKDELELSYEHALKLRGNKKLHDDFSILKISFL